MRLWLTCKMPTSFDEAFAQDEDVYSAPVAIKKLHEFLMAAEAQPVLEVYELRTVYARKQTPSFGNVSL